MKSLLIAAIIFILSSSTAFCAPWLTCDCTPALDGVTGFEYTNNNGAPIAAPAVLICGTGPDSVICTGAERTMCVDLSSLPSGSYSFKAKAINIWGMSNDSVPLNGSKSIPSISPTLRITK
jgi:hypothetical protein